MKSEWLSEIWRYRELLYFLAWRDVKVRYKQAALGVLWAVIQPLLTMLIFSLFFGRLAGIPSDGIPYPLFSYCALVPWIYFSVTLGQSANSLLSNSNLITKVYFPRVLLPASSALSGLLDFLVGALLLVGLMAYYRVRPSWGLLLFPVMIVVLVLFTLGISMLFAAMNVRFRDVKYAIPFLIQIWLFVTPIIYPINFVSPRLRVLLALNPLSGIIDGFRACIFPQRKLDLSLMGVSLAITVAVFFVGVIFFRRTERTFADII